ncbi:unnamed protein product [Gongylonema pulchrum]|uniref:Pre-mRNA-splicing factor SYF2 n=1 Tax=Gongylonema pulchrum TaxID=637853 RepID=A0A183EH62_9BILA|nr:unnamed protein product [Gongylonema pulchrum]
MCWLQMVLWGNFVVGGGALRVALRVRCVATGLFVHVVQFLFKMVRSAGGLADVHACSIRYVAAAAEPSRRSELIKRRRSASPAISQSSHSWCRSLGRGCICITMADDLSQFFAKKSAKVKDRKKKVKLSVDEVGQVLERKAKRQEERDREDEEEERRAQDDAAFFEKHPEDSEWLEYKDTNKSVTFYAALIELGSPRWPC